MHRLVSPYRDRWAIAGPSPGHPLGGASGDPLPLLARRDGLLRFLLKFCVVQVSVSSKVIWQFIGFAPSHCR